MEFLPGIVVSVVRARGNPGPGPGRGTMYLIIRPAHAYLEETLRQAFEGQENVKIIVDRRSGERRTNWSNEEQRSRSKAQWRLALSINSRSRSMPTASQP